MLETTWCKQRSRETKTVKVTGTKITKIKALADGDSVRDLKIQHENGTDHVFNPYDGASEKIIDVPEGHQIIGMYGHGGTQYFVGFGFITAKF